VLRRPASLRRTRSRCAVCTLPHLNHSPTTVPYRATGHVLSRHFMILRWLCCFCVSSVVCCVTHGSQDNLFEWHFTIRGPPDSPFANGLYHGRILLDSDYPFKPPNFMLLTVRSASLPLRPDSATLPLRLNPSASTDGDGRPPATGAAAPHARLAHEVLSCTQQYHARECASRDTSPRQDPLQPAVAGGRLVVPRLGGARRAKALAPIGDRSSAAACAIV
jgi:hypothetical protein